MKFHLEMHHEAELWNQVLSKKLRSERPEEERDAVKIVAVDLQVLIMKRILPVLYNLMVGHGTPAWGSAAAAYKMHVYVYVMMCRGFTPNSRNCAYSLLRTEV